MVCGSYHAYVSPGLTDRGIHVRSALRALPVEHLLSLWTSVRRPRPDSVRSYRLPRGFVPTGVKEQNLVEAGLQPGLSCLWTFSSSNRKPKHAAVRPLRERIQFHFRHREISPVVRNQNAIVFDAGRCNQRIRQLQGPPLLPPRTYEFSGAPPGAPRQFVALQ
jgi:hypothetical protein